MKLQATTRLPAALLLFAAAACSKSNAAEHNPTPTTQASATVQATTASPQTPTPSAKVGEADKPLELHVSANGTSMQFEPTKLEAKAGQSIHLVFENKKPGALPHNWALVTTGSEAKVAAAGLDKAASNYIAESPDLLAYTPLAAPGATSDVTFKAPAAGTYPYICTFPGHYMMMKGVLTVTP